MNRPKQKSTSFHVRNVLENYNHSLTVTDGKKMNICLYTADDEHLNYWNRVLSRMHGATSSSRTHRSCAASRLGSSYFNSESEPGKEMLMLSCAAGYAGAAVNGLSATAEVPTTVLRAAAIIIRQLTDASTRTHTAGTEEGAHERAGFGQGQHANGVACDGAHQQRPPPVREGQPGHRQEFAYVTASHTRWVLQPSQPPAHTT